MPHVSKYKHSKEIEDGLIKSLNTALSKIENSNDMFGFINTLLTETEKVMLAKRFATIVLIEEKSQDSEISRKLHLTRMTIAKIRYFYEARGRAFKITLSKLEKQNRLETIKKFLSSIPE